MNTTQVKLTNGSNVYILENVLATDTLAYAHELANSFSPNNPAGIRSLQLNDMVCAITCGKLDTY